MRDGTGGGGENRWFFYNEKWQVIEERVSSQNYWNAPADAQYVYHPQYVDAVALRYWDSDATGGADKEHYYLQDSNFNVTAIVENDGTVAERYAYSPYGEVTVLDADFSVDADGKSDIDNEYLYTGRRLDPETGLQLNRERFYIPPLGRWANRDPIEYFGSEWNLYEYVKARPVSTLDPEGLFDQYLPWFQWCKEKASFNVNQRTECKNQINSMEGREVWIGVYKACKKQGYGYDYCEQKMLEVVDEMRRACEQRFPEIDCSYECRFEPSACWEEAVGFLGQALLCGGCLLKEKPHIAKCLDDCKEVIDQHEPYRKCMEGPAIGIK